MVDDLRAENTVFRLFRKFTREAQLLALSSIAIVVACLSLLLAFMALDNAKDAKLRAEYQDKYIEDLSDKIGVLEVRVINAEKDK